LLSAVASLVTVASASASTCLPGDLDSRYCDRDGDMVADAPENPAEGVDPDTLVFAYTPVEDPEVYRGVWHEFLDHRSKTTGKTIQAVPVQSTAAQLEAMRSGRVHVAGFNTGSNPLAVNCAGFVPSTMMAARNNASG